MSTLEITNSRVRLYNRADDKLKAFATITFNDCFVVTDLKVINGNKGLFVAMPSRKRRDGKFRDIAHPLNAECRQMIEEQILKLYHEECARAGVDPEVGGGGSASTDAAASIDDILDELSEDQPGN